jgi:hypothetical protein
MGGLGLCRVCFVVGWILEHRHFCGRILVGLTDFSPPSPLDSPTFYNPSAFPSWRL